MHTEVANGVPSVMLLVAKHYYTRPGETIFLMNFAETENNPLLQRDTSLSGVCDRGRKRFREDFEREGWTIPLPAPWTSRPKR